MTFVLFVVVVVVASTVAHLFRSALGNAIELVADGSAATTASTALSTPVLFALATVSVLVAAALGQVAHRRWTGRSGIEAIAASARGDARSMSVRGTVVRVLATFVVSAGLVSIGRESAIVESGGVTGAALGRASRGRGDALASAGIAAAFASAYNAPIAAVLYAEEHLRIRRSNRATVFVVGGAVAGHALTTQVFDGGPIFPDVDGSMWRVAVLGLVVLVPTVMAAKAFLQLRVRITADALVRRLRWPKPVVVGLFAVVAGLSVAAFPLAAGNGMDAIDRAPIAATTALAVALVVGKSVGTTAALGAGAPGGVLSPTMGVAGGTALLVLLAAESLGAGVARPWDAIVPAMAVGVAVGMRSPLVAVFLVPELLGDYSLVIPVALVVAADRKSVV